MGFKLYYKVCLLSVDTMLENVSWKLVECFKLYLIAIGCIIDELTVRWWKKPEIKTGFRSGAAVNKVAIVTGGSSGIGLEISKILCSYGIKTIIAGRNEGRGLKAVGEIRKSNTKADVKFMYLDLSSMKSVEAFAQEFQSSGLPLNYLINNAGVMLCPHWTTHNGFEQHFGVNYLGHVHLTNLLMKNLQASGEACSYARIVNVTSEAYSAATLDLSDLNSRKRYSSHHAYAQSKLALLMWTLKLQRELSATPNCYVTVNAVHPGVIKTDLYRHCSWFTRVLSTVGSLVMKSASAGAYTCAYAALSRQLEGLGGLYMREQCAVRTTSESVNVAKQDELWSATQQMIATAQANIVRA